MSNDVEDDADIKVEDEDVDENSIPIFQSDNDQQRAAGMFLLIRVFFKQF